MEIDKVFGVPSHPLFVHIPVVLIPLAAIGAVLLVARPSWRRPYGPLVIALAALGALGAQLATASGESLRDARRVRDLGDHAEYGELARTVAFLLLALVIGLYVLDRWRDHRRLRRMPRWVSVGIALLTVVGAIGATAAVAAAGHTGARRTWRDSNTAAIAPASIAPG